MIRPFFLFPLKVRIIESRLYYLANIALNLEPRFNSGVNLTIYLKLVLQK